MGMMKTPDEATKATGRSLILGAIALVAVAAGFASYYVATKFPTPSSDRRSPVATPSGVASDSLSFSFFEQPRAIPQLSFIDGDGRTRSLADFKGKPILLNIWATWCAPCRKEMPSLDRLQASLGPSQLLILPVSMDRQGLLVVKKFYDELGFRSLGIFLDQSASTASKINVVGLPTTLFIDRNGREIGRKNGPAEWDSPDIAALVRERLGLASGNVGNR
jgi:thiol-disulfide isomerase/thioredoxin